MKYNIGDKLEFRIFTGSSLYFKLIEINEDNKTYKFIVEGEPGNGEIIEIEQDFSYKYFSKSLLLAKLSEKIGPSNYVRKYNLNDQLEINFETGHRLVLKVVDINDELNEITFFSQGTPGGGNTVVISKDFASKQFSQDILLAKLSEAMNQKEEHKQYIKK